MAPDDTPDAEVEGWLQTLGVKSLCQWDVLVFLYRHQTSLFDPEYFARLLGYKAAAVVTALDALRSLGLLACSRVSEGVRLYQFTAPTVPPRGHAFDQLLALVGDRGGRVMLSNLVRKGDRTPERGLEPAQRFPDEVRYVVGALLQGSRYRDEGSKTWRKAI
jgi:hypothetical protein